VNAIEHKLATKIKGLLHVRQTCLKDNEYLFKYKGCHHKEVVWMKLAHLDHLSNMVSKFEQDRGHELGMKKTRKKKTPT
jgi:hypothetical protein